MAEKINAGTILIKEDTLLPQSVQLESAPYLKGWRLVKSPGSSGNRPATLPSGMDLFLHGG